jgi:hypothetical protein
LRRPAVVVAFFAALAAPPLVAVVVFQPGQSGLALDVYLLFLGAVALLALAHATRAAEQDGKSLLEEALRRGSARAEPLAQLDSLERQVTLGLGNAFDLHYRLRPLLRGVAAERLAARGISLDDEEEARAVLGEAAWELLRPDREPPRDRFARGATTADLDALLTRIETV